MMRGVMSQYPRGGYSPQRGYDVMMNALAASSSTAQKSIGYLTIISWASSSATMSGASANGLGRQFSAATYLAR